MLDWLFGSKKQEPKKQKPKKKKTQKQAEAEDRWMYEFMVQFLSSPIWRVSILDFVDNKCIVFDNEEENKFEYTTIHNEFKELVGNLVDGMMEEIGLDQEKLAELIEKGFQSKDKKLFNQLLLADDFLRFKDLMLKRNRTLEQEAIAAMQGGESSIKKSKIDRDRDAIRESQRDETQRQQKLQREEEEMIRKAIEMSIAEDQESSAIKRLQQKAAEHEIRTTNAANTEQSPSNEAQEAVAQNQPKQSLEQKPKEVKKPSRRSSKLQPLDRPKASQLGDLPPLTVPKQEIISEEKTEQKEDDFSHMEENYGGDNLTDNKQSKNSFKKEPQQKPFESKQEQKPVEKPKESIEDRKARLLAQREKIRKQKEEQRRKNLENEQKEKEVHNIVLQDDGIHETQIREPVAENTNKVNEEQLKRRKELMNRIKNRIIDDF